MSRKTKVIGIRVDQEVDERLLNFEAATGIERVTLARNAMLAALDFFDRNGRVSFPLRVIEVGKAGTSRSSEEIADLRPQDQGTPVLDAEPVKTTSSEKFHKNNNF